MIELDVEGPAALTAGDILTNSDISISLIIISLQSVSAGFKENKNGCNSGRGYVPAAIKDDAPVGTLAVNSLSTRL